MFHEIYGNFNNMTIRTFKVGLLAKHDLRKSLTRKPVGNMRQLMDCINEYKRVEKDQQQGNGKAKVIPQERISGWIGTIAIDLGEILLSTLARLPPRWLVLYFENPCIKF